MMRFELPLIRSGLVPLVNQAELADNSGNAAVLVPIVKYNGEWCLLLTKRAINMRHHGGEVAFPGGMWEQGDAFPVATALREAEEEVALVADQVDILGLLPAMPTRNGTKVTPVVGLIDAELSLVANPREIASIFFTPLTDLRPENRIRTDVFNHRTPPIWIPAYNYEGHEIWGFTARVIKILLERCFNTEFEREHSAPEKIWQR